MNQEDQTLTRCLSLIEEKTGWGPATDWTNQDFTTLSDNIADATGVHLSPTTLKRVWGRVAYSSNPSPTTLDTLGAYLGYENWRAFRQDAKAVNNKNLATPERMVASGSGAGLVAKGGAIENDDDHGINENQGPKPLARANVPPELQRRRARNPLRLYLYYLLPLAALALSINWLFPTSAAPAPAPSPTLAATETSNDSITLNPADFSFNFRPVSIGVPNSVVFTYDVSAAPTNDTVLLQQNWDPSRRFQLPREENIYTSIYYLPGFFKAKLVVGDQIVKERDVYIRSEGWVAAVKRQPVPVYLPLEEVHNDGRLAVTPKLLQELEVPLQPEPPNVLFTHVGALDGLYSDDFAFRTRLRHDYSAGTAACQRIRVLLLLKDGAIIIPLSQPGCTADLRLFAGGRSVDGKTNDLSAFGVVSEDQWLELACTGEGDLLTFSMNGKAVFSLESQEGPKEFVGIRYEFAGPGSVDELEFGNSGGLVWREAF